MSDDPDPHTASRPDPDDRAGRGWRIAAVVAVIAALGAVGTLGYLLFAGGSTNPKGDVRACIIDPSSRDFTKSGSKDGHDKPADCPPKGAKQADGLVEQTNEGGFTMREIRNGSVGETISLYVREPDRPYIDIAHAQTHAALGQPIRVYTLEIEGREAVVYMEDAPLLG